jgi:major membrane immunogen (membrane-anchored lipoprotein)
MQKNSAAFVLVALVAFTACKGHEKKILVYANSDVQVDNTKTHITVTDGGPHHEQELDFASGDPVTLDVQSPSGKLSLTASDDGLYILNLKTDTVVGSKQHVGAEGEGRITQDALTQKLDSLKKLVADQNVSDANQNYFILPGKMARITPETQAKVFGPFTTVPGGFDAGSVPAIYKFYSMKEMREIIASLQKMTSSKIDTVPETKK